MMSLTTSVYTHNRTGDVAAGLGGKDDIVGIPKHFFNIQESYLIVNNSALITPSLLGKKGCKMNRFSSTVSVQEYLGMLVVSIDSSAASASHG